MKLKIPEYIDVSSSNFIYSVVTGVEGEYLSVSDLAHIKNLSVDNIRINKVSSLLPSDSNVSIGSQTESFKNLYVGTVYLVSNNLILGQLSSNKLALFSNENEFSITEDFSSSSTYSILKRRVQTENVGSIDYSTRYDQNDHQDYDYNSIVFSIATGASTTDSILELNKDYVVCNKPLSLKGNILKGDRTNYIYPEVDGTLNLGYVWGSTQNRFNIIYCNTLDASVNVNSGLVGLERANLQADYAPSSSSTESYGFGRVSLYIKQDIVGTPQYEQSLTFKSHHVSGSLVTADYYLLEPSENNKIDLGSSTNKFRNVYANSLVIESDSSSEDHTSILSKDSFSFNRSIDYITFPVHSCVLARYDIEGYFNGGSYLPQTNEFFSFLNGTGFLISRGNQDLDCADAFYVINNALYQIYTQKDTDYIENSGWSTGSEPKKRLFVGHNYQNKVSSTGVYKIQIYMSNTGWSGWSSLGNSISIGSNPRLYPRYCPIYYQQRGGYSGYFYKQSFMCYIFRIR